jgi:hypothetical protein
VCESGYHAFVEAERSPRLFCSRCGEVRPITPSPHETTPRPASAKPPVAASASPGSDVPLDEQAALDEEIFRLLREGGLEPDELIARARHNIEADDSTEVPEVDEEAVTIDGRTFTAHATRFNGAARAPVDADLYNDRLPDPGL